MLEMASGDFHCAGYFFGGIFTVLDTSLEGFSLCWRLLLENSTVLGTALEGFSRCWRLLLEI